MSDSLFELSGVTRRHGGDVALRDLSLHMRVGEVLGVVGPNGAGKSTLMRVLLGLIPAQSGEVRVFGVDPWREPLAVRSRTGYASDGRDQDSRATVGELQALHRALYPRWDAEFAQRLIGPLGGRPTSRIDRLSRGEAQRVRIALAMAHRPELLLLDEPGAGLDPSLRREFLEDAVELLGDSETSIVINSHHLSDIERIASRIVLMSAGRIVLDVELDTLREQYCLATFDERQLDNVQQWKSNGNSDAAAHADVSTPVVAQRGTDMRTSIPTCVGHRRRNGEVKVVLRCDAQAGFRELRQRGVQAHVTSPNLEELYVVLVGGSHEHA